jgi:hypothetical protein
MHLLDLSNDILCTIFALLACYKAQHTIQCTSKSLHALCPEFVNGPTCVRFVLEGHTPTLTWTPKTSTDSRISFHFPSSLPITHMFIDCPDTSDIARFVPFVLLSTRLVSLSVNGPAHTVALPQVSRAIEALFVIGFRRNPEIRVLSMTWIALDTITTRCLSRSVRQCANLRILKFSHTRMLTNQATSLMWNVGEGCKDIAHVDISKNDFECYERFALRLYFLIYSCHKLEMLSFMPSEWKLTIPDQRTLKEAIMHATNLRGSPVETDLPEFFAAS